ncbi:13525_t:CDS:10 [Dentiscutata erythropus]|uniref:Mediator of RNA polymerase II transcription subunit 12 n=1 Tax=Dentiscutata erythropus TaxID=1348616 RepID=A0A9N9FMU3_9GLOM|nr:13525_t:CDS:10 [Dentiscutata erythropus]
MAQNLSPYKLQPPKNLSALHKTSVELGYPDFYPPKPGQDEDLMTEQHVQQGFSGALFVDAESFSAQDMILDEIRDPKGLGNLGEFMTDIMKRKHEINTFEESSPYTVPQIVWVPVEDRDEWLRRLAGNSPLKELAENVPRVVEGTHLLELVTQHRVPLARATWFTKIVGINLINSRTGHQETSHNATQEYTKNWNSTFHTFIKNQSREYDPDNILLAKWQFDDGLLDQRILRSTLENLDQADHLNTVIWLWFVQQFLEEFQHIVCECEVITIAGNTLDTPKPKARYCRQDVEEYATSTPDMFVFPVCWNTYKDLLRCVFVEDNSLKTDTVIPKNTKRQMERYYELIRARNEVFDKEKPDMIGKRNAQELQQSRIIEILDKVGFHTDYQKIAAEYFRIDSKFPMLEREVSTHIYWLCYWAVTKYRAGDYRVYSVSTILDIWKSSVTNAEERLQRQTTIQNSLMDFLDIYPLGCNGICEEDVAGLFGELIRNGHFSHQRYLQRLVARGDVLHERRVTEDTSDEKEYESMVMMIKDKLPYLFSRTEKLDSPTVDNPVSDMHLALNFHSETTEFMQNVTKFCQIKVIQTWLLPQVKTFVQNTPIGPHNWHNPTQPGSSLLNARQLSTIVKVIELAKDYNSLLDLLLWVLENSTEKCLFQSIIDTLKRHEVVWDAMGKSEQVLDALMKKNDQLRDMRQTETCIVKYLINFTHDYVNAKKGKLEQDLQSQMKSQLSQAVSHHYTRFEGYNSMKQFLSRVRASNIESRLFQSDGDGIYKIFESYINIIIQYSHNYADENYTEGRIVIGIFGDLLVDICDRTTDELDFVFEKWIKCLSHVDEDNIFGNENILLLYFFVMLVVRHLVCMKIIIEHLCDKNLKILVEKLSNQRQMDPKEVIECKNLVKLLRLLLLQDGDNLSIQLPLCTTEIQVLKSHCETLSHHNDFIVIASTIFQKLAIIECLIDSKDQLIDVLIQLRIDFSKIEWFRQLCVINSETVYDRFVKGKRLLSNKEVEKRILNIVQTALGDDVAKSSQTASVYIKYLRTILSQISLWNIQKNRIEFWLCMDQIMLIDSTIPRSSSTSTIKDEDDIIANFGEFPKNESLKNAVIDWLWEELILKGEIDCGFLSNMIKGIMEDVSIELFEKGLCILKKCTELISDIEEIFRSLLLTLSVDKKINFCDALLSQIKKIQDDFPYDSSSIKFGFESHDNVYVSSIISRVKLLVLGAHVLTSRVTEVITQTNPAIVRQIPEYALIEKLFVTLVNLLCDPRIHQNGGGFAHFDLILDLVSFLLDEMGKNARAVIVAELKNHKIDNIIPAIWSNRIKRVLPLIFVQETIGEGEKKHKIDPWKMIEGLGEDDDLTSSPNDLSWYNSKVYPRPNKRLKRVNVNNSNSTII